MMKRIAYIFLLFFSAVVLMLCLLPFYRCAEPVQLVFSVQAESPATLTVTPGMGQPVTVSVAAGETQLSVPLSEKRVSAVELRQSGTAVLHLSTPALTVDGKTALLGQGAVELHSGTPQLLQTAGETLKQRNRMRWVPFIVCLVVSMAAAGGICLWARRRFRCVRFALSLRQLPDVAFCSLFCLLPVLAYVSMDKAEISLAENRRLAEFPAAVTADGSPNAAFGKEFESWLQDRFTGRALLVRAHTKARSLLSGSLSENDQAVLYRNHWGFFKPYVNISAPTESDYQQMLENLRRLQTWCAERHIDLCLFVTPMKEDIFADMNPAGAKNPGDVTEAFVERIRHDLPTLRLCYPRAAMLAARDTQHPPYYLTDTHINEDGAYMLCGELLNALAADFPALSLPPKNAFRCSPIRGRFYAELNPDGTEEGVAPGKLVGMLQENAAEVEDCDYNHYEPDTAPAAVAEQGAEHREILTRCPAGHYRAVLLGDSNTQYYRRWLQHSFREMRRFRANNGVEQEKFRMGRWEERIADFAPDVLIITISGSSLFSAIPQMY